MNPDTIRVESIAATIRNSRLLAEAAAAMPTSSMASVNSAPP
jgi:hypothetical protein